MKELSRFSIWYFTQFIISWSTIIKYIIYYFYIFFFSIFFGFCTRTQVHLLTDLRLHNYWWLIIILRNINFVIFLPIWKYFAWVVDRCVGGSLVNLRWILGAWIYWTSSWRWFVIDDSWSWGCFINGFGWISWFELIGSIWRRISALPPLSEIYFNSHGSRLPYPLRYELVKMPKRCRI